MVTKNELIPIVYKIVHIMTGLDFGYIKFKSFKMKCLVNGIIFLILVASSALILIQLKNDEDPIKLYRYACYESQLFMYFVCYMLMDRSVTLAGCKRLFKSVDAFLKMDSENYYITHLCLMLLFLTYRILITVGICLQNSHCLTGIWKNVFFFWVFLAYDFSAVTNMYVFYLIKCRIVAMSKELFASGIRIHTSHCVYRDICEIAIKIKKGYDPVFCCTLLFNIIQNMVFIYVREVENKQTSMPIWIWTVNGELLMVIMSIFTTFGPAVVASQLSSKTEEIKIIQHNMLYEERDKQKRRDLNKFIRYIEARPLKFCIWKVIPLDSSLPGMVLSISVSYLVVVMQLTHLYRVIKIH